MTAQRSCEQFVKALKTRYDGRLVSVVLFGSMAQGRSRPTSDVDLLVVVRGLPRSRLDRHGQMLAIAHRVSEAFAQQVSTIPLTPGEAADVKPFYLGMLSGHRILFDRGQFFQRVLQRLRKRLKELGSQRIVEVDGAEYWILQPGLRLGEAVVL